MHLEATNVHEFGSKHKLWQLGNKTFTIASHTTQILEDCKPNCNVIDCQL